MRAPICVLLALALLQSDVALGDVAKLSCTGKLFAPDMTGVAIQISGSVTVDLDNKEVLGIISGHITKASEREVDFEAKFQSNNYSDSPTVYRRGHIDGLTGQAWQVDTRSERLVPITDIADYAAFDLACSKWPVAFHDVGRQHPR